MFDPNPDDIAIHLNKKLGPSKFRAWHNLCILSLRFTMIYEMLLARRLLLVQASAELVCWNGCTDESNSQATSDMQVTPGDCKGHPSMVSCGIAWMANIFYPISYSWKGITWVKKGKVLVATVGGPKLQTSTSKVWFRREGKFHKGV